MAEAKGSNLFSSLRHSPETNVRVLGVSIPTLKTAVITGGDDLGDVVADPFHERVRGEHAMRKRVLGGEFFFESDSEALMELVEWAYGNLPEHAFPQLDMDFHVVLRLLPPRPCLHDAEPPPMRLQSGSGLLCGVMDAWNYVVLMPEQRRALVVASEDMLRHAYHLRYELIEFAVFTLAARGLGLVPLHGACVGRNGRGVLLLGASGAGKSTLALQGLSQGMDFLAEDAVFVHPEHLLATGVANFLHVKTDALQFVHDERVRRWIEHAPVIRRRSGVAKWEADLRVWRDRLVSQPLSLAAVVFASEEMAADPALLLKPMHRSDVVQSFCADQPYAAGQPGWQRFMQELPRVGVYELRRGPHPAASIRALWLLLE